MPQSVIPMSVIPMSVIYDTEYTAWQGSIARNWQGPGEHREIVEIGAICIDSRSLAELGAFSVLVRPQKNPILSDYFVGLTGITNDLLASAATGFAEALARFDRFVGVHSIYAYGRDDHAMAETASLQKVAFNPARWHTNNLRDWFAKAGLDIARLHSSDLAAACGASNMARAHRALDDARAIAVAIRALMANGHHNPFVTT